MRTCDYCWEAMHCSLMRFLLSYCVSGYFQAIADSPARYKPVICLVFSRFAYAGNVA